MSYPSSTDSTMHPLWANRSLLDQLLQGLRDTRMSLSEQLHDLECVIEQTGNDVLQHRCRITLPYVQTLESRLDSIHRSIDSTVAQSPELQERLTTQQQAELKAMNEEKLMIDDQLQHLEDIAAKCKRIKGTILTLKRLAMVNMQNRQQSSSPRRFAHLGGIMNRAAGDINSMERTRLYGSVKAVKPDSAKRMKAIKQQEILATQRKRVLALENHQDVAMPARTSPSPSIPSPSSHPTTTSTYVLNRAGSLEPRPAAVTAADNQRKHTANKEDKRAPLAIYSDDSLSSTTTDTWYPEEMKLARSTSPFNPSSVIAMIDESSDSTLDYQHSATPTGILKSTGQSTTFSGNSPKQSLGRGSRVVMFNTTVTVDDGSEVVRLNCTLDESELGKHRVPPTEKQATSSSKTIDKISRTKLTVDKQLGNKIDSKMSSLFTRSPNTAPFGTSDTHIALDGVCTIGADETDSSKSKCAEKLDAMRSVEQTAAVPTPPPRRSSQTNCSSTTEADGLHAKTATPAGSRKEYENLDIHKTEQSPKSKKKLLPLPVSSDASDVLPSPCE